MKAIEDIQPGDEVILPKGLHTHGWVGTEVMMIPVLPPGTRGMIVDKLAPKPELGHPDFSWWSLQIKFPMLPVIGILYPKDGDILEFPSEHDVTEAV